ncbi:hypothetical protein BV898_08151 [Hypsibius exemplaris]|uniref:Uncharacterized protein n=1 Tax=Hypsibius exemplaris TaxID=2072580 RepID=A0A1W0WRB4_HYPEX|nr:hypothetical protein BV898_08151 [Hypsibius exemplaris]
MAAFKNKICLGFSPALTHDDAQTLLMTDIQRINQPCIYMIAVINHCNSSVRFRITCDDLDSGQKVLTAHEMCRVSFWTESPKDTLVFCQTRDLMERTLNFDAWGGSAPRDLNVWSLLPDSDNGLALNGQVRKGWSGSVKAVSGFAEGIEEMSEDEDYFDLNDPETIEFGFDGRISDLYDGQRYLWSGHS